jgi:hypothetical protein
VSNFDSILGLVLPLLFGGFFGYELGKSKGWRGGVDESFDPFYEEGYYNGWLARHHRVPLEDKRVHPNTMQRLVPTLMGPGQEIAHWTHHGDHLSFEEYRREEADKLNRQIDQPQ